MIKTQAKLLQLLKNAEFPIDVVMYAYHYGLSLSEARFAVALSNNAIDLEPELVLPEGQNSEIFMIEIIEIDKILINVSEEEFNKLVTFENNFFEIQVPKFEAKNDYLIKYYAEKWLEDYVNLKIRTDQEVIIEDLIYKEYRI